MIANKTDPVANTQEGMQQYRTRSNRNVHASVQVNFEDSLGAVDFYVSSHTGVIYVPEADAVAGLYKKKVAKFRKANQAHGVVMVERNSSFGSYFAEVQRFCVMEAGLHLVAVGTQSEAAALLAQMVRAESHLSSNPLLKMAPSTGTDSSSLVTLQCVPGLGEVRARELLLKFHSIQGVSSASVEELSKVVGQANASSIHKYFTQEPG